MIPRTVHFTGLEVDPISLIKGRQHKGAIPPHWPRVRFESDGIFSLDKLNRWIGANISGRWQTYSVARGFSKRTVVVAFEDDSDAVLFRLKGGETAWQERVETT